MSYYSSDDEIDVRVRRGHRDPSPGPVHYVEARPPRPRSYYATGPSYLTPERTVVTTASRSRSRERRSTPPSSQAPVAPVIINNFAGHSSDEESITDERNLVLARHHSHSHPRSRATSNSGYMTREEYELEEARRELEELRVQNAQAARKRDDWELTRAKREVDEVKAAHQAEREGKLREKEYIEHAELSRAKRELDEIKSQQARDHEERMREKEYKDHAELSRAKRELDEIRRREERELEEKRIRKELELKQLEQQRREKEEKEQREKAEREAIERYKLKEAERAAKERDEKERIEKEYQRRLQEDLLKAGMEEQHIQAIINKDKITTTTTTTVVEKKERPTYTRMARRHLSIETLRVYGIDFEYDTDPNYVVIKRWVPEEEQDTLWRHTRLLREKREAKVVVKIDDRPHRSHHSRGLEPEFEWVRKKERRRSKSPGLLMYLAGAK